MEIPKIIKVLIGILISFGILFYFIWSGVRGLLSFLFGMGVMAYLILSGNSLILWIVDATRSREYVNELKR